MGLRFAHCLGPVEHLQPKEWTRETASGAIALRCPNCYGISDVPETHVPAKTKDGRYVTDQLRYVWSCPFQECAAWDFVTVCGLMEDS